MCLIFFFVCFCLLSCSIFRRALRVCLGTLASGMLFVCMFVVCDFIVLIVEV